MTARTPRIAVRLLLLAILLAHPGCTPRNVRTVYRCPDGQTFAVTRSPDGKTATLEAGGTTRELPLVSTTEAGTLFSADAVFLGIEGDKAYVAEGEVVVHQDCAAEHAYTASGIPGNPVARLIGIGL